jgi:hypothetical protein
MTQDEAYNLLDEFNTILKSPLKNSSIQKAIRSAFSGKYKGANKEYINQILEIWSDSKATFSSLVPSQYWYKHKKARKDRVRSHWYEWEHDIIDFLNAQKNTEKGFVYFTQKEICEALQIPRSTLNNVLKKSRQIYIHVIGKGSQRQTGLSTLLLLFNNAIGRTTEQKELYLEFIQSIIPGVAERLYDLLPRDNSDSSTLNTG